MAEDAESYSEQQELSQELIFSMTLASTNRQMKALIQFVPNGKH